MQFQFGEGELLVPSFTARKIFVRRTSHGRFTVSLDFPSGHGFPRGVDADATLTLALPKEGLRAIAPVYLADLGLPSALWARMALDVPPLFGEGRILQVVP